ncbi:hypothetical protein WJX73_008133 [Symbiochloris irregularis]|uniref:Uncharacterized protein n=1 Tax=Symbiochloris irregularis TaxID=706552 RepID=A0AAW1PJU8_9CHLO
MQARPTARVVFDHERQLQYTLRLPVTKVRSSNDFLVAEEADKAWLYLTSGRASRNILFEPNKQRAGWQASEGHHPKVQLFKEHVLDYDADYNLFLLKDSCKHMFGKHVRVTPLPRWEGAFKGAVV